MTEISDPRLAAFKKLLDIMDDLREKCPWDQKQTLESLSLLTIEEVYELNDAIYEKNHPHIEEELGDLLLHIVFYAKIGHETQYVTTNPLALLLYEDDSFNKLHHLIHKLLQ